MSVPHDAQEALSSERTPTHSYSLPFYLSLICQWEDMKQNYPLLSPYIQIGISKVGEYVNKSKLSRTYLLAICKQPPPFERSTLTVVSLVLNPCLKAQWIKENCPESDYTRVCDTAIEMVRPVQH